jgi:hypothetical protein
MSLGNYSHNKKNNTGNLSGYCVKTAAYFSCNQFGFGYNAPLASKKN